MSGYLFIASIVGIPNLSVVATTKTEAIVKVKAALESQLAKGKLITIEIDTATDSFDAVSQLSYAGIVAIIGKTMACSCVEVLCCLFFVSRGIDLCGNL